MPTGPAYSPPNIDRETYRLLAAYDGESSFLRSLAVRVRAGHGLTVRQLAAARRCIAATPVRELEDALTRHPAAQAALGPARPTQDDSLPCPPMPRVPRGPRTLPR